MQKISADGPDTIVAVAEVEIPNPEDFFICNRHCLAGYFDLERWQTWRE